MENLKMDMYEKEYNYKNVLSPIYIAFYSFCLLFVCCTGIKYYRQRNNIKDRRRAYSV